LNKRNIYIGLFSILYLIVAFSSFFHAVSFFELANVLWMGIILAFAFEIGQAAVLFSLLTSKKDRNRVIPWALMAMFTLVQIIGNIFSSYKYLMTNSTENLRYFKEPIFIWTDLPDDQATVIIVYLVGALLPLAALLLTSMITNYLSDTEEEKKQLENKFLNEGEDSLLNQNSILNMENKGLQEQVDKLKQDLEKKNDSLSAFGEAVENRDNHIENLEKEIETLKNSSDINEEIKKENEELKNKLEETEKNLEVEKEKIIKEQQEYDKTLQEQIEKTKNIYNEVQNLNEDIKSKQEIIDSQKKELEELKSKKEENPVEEKEEKKESHFINL